MPHRNATCSVCSICSDIGTLGRNPSTGYPVYCGCIKGLEAHINHLAFCLQEYAETLSRHRARWTAGRPLLSQEDVENIEFAYRMTQYAHDQLDERRTDLILEGIDLHEPEVGFFPDYEEAL